MFCVWVKAGKQSYKSRVHLNIQQNTYPLQQNTYPPCVRKHIWKISQDLVLITPIGCACLLFFYTENNVPENVSGVIICGGMTVTIPST